MADPIKPDVGTAAGGIAETLIGGAFANPLGVLLIGGNEALKRAGLGDKLGELKDTIKGKAGDLARNAAEASAPAARDTADKLGAAAKNAGGGFFDKIGKVFGLDAGAPTPVAPAQPTVVIEPLKKEMDPHYNFGPMSERKDSPNQSGEAVGTTAAQPPQDPAVVSSAPVPSTPVPATDKIDPRKLHADAIRAEVQASLTTETARNSGSKKGSGLTEVFERLEGTQRMILGQNNANKFNPESAVYPGLTLNDIAEMKIKMLQKAMNPQETARIKSEVAKINPEYLKPEYITP